MNLTNFVTFIGYALSAICLSACSMCANQEIPISEKDQFDMQGFDWIFGCDRPKPVGDEIVWVKKFETRVN